MKLRFRLLILAAVAWPGAWPALSQSATSATDVHITVVYINDDSIELVGSGRALASGIFKKIGVRIAWCNGELPAGRNAFGIRTLEQAPDSATPGALAATRLVGSAGTEIVIYRDRVRIFLSANNNLAAAGRGYILAHELAHAMQGVPRHSESGILDAHWSRLDYQEMAFQKLAFTGLDVDLIHRGLAARTANLPAGFSGGSESAGH